LITLIAGLNFLDNYYAIIDFPDPAPPHIPIIIIFFIMFVLYNLVNCGEINYPIKFF